jgi:hypothetical protein
MHLYIQALQELYAQPDGRHFKSGNRYRTLYKMEGFLLVDRSCKNKCGSLRTIQHVLIFVHAFMWNIVP